MEKNREIYKHIYMELIFVKNSNKVRTVFETNGNIHIIKQTLYPYLIAYTMFIAAFFLITSN